MAENTRIVPENESPGNGSQASTSGRKRKRSRNLVIITGGKKLCLSEEVTNAASDIFHTKSPNNGAGGQHESLELKHVDPLSMEHFIDFICSNKADASEDDIEELLRAASLIKLNKVVAKICNHLAILLNQKSFFRIRNMAIKYSIQSLKDVCNKYAADKILLLATEEEFNDLEADYVFFLISALQSSLVEVDFKVAIALKWIKADLANREKYFMEIVSLLDLSKVTSGYVKVLVESESLCLKFPKFILMLCKGMAKSHQTDATGPPSLTKMADRSAVTSPDCLIIFNDSSRHLRLFQPSKNKMIQLKPYHEEMRYFFVACTKQDCLYVLDNDRKAFRLNLSRKYATWKRLNDMLDYHGDHLQCAVYENHIYVGGCDKLERYEMQEGGKWENIDMNGNSCHDSALVSYDDGVYVIGGLTHHCPFCCMRRCFEDGKVRKFSPISSTWSHVPQMHFTRIRPSAVVYAGKIFVAGGSPSSDHGEHEFEMYDRATQCWTLLPSILLSPKLPIRLCIVDDLIFAIGLDPAEQSIRSERYDPRKQEWALGFTSNLMAWSVEMVSTCSSVVLT